MAGLLVVPALGAGATNAAKHHRPAPQATADGQPAPAGIGRLDAVACAAPSSCWAVSATPAPPGGPTGAGTTTTSTTTTTTTSTTTTTTTTAPGQAPASPPDTATAAVAVSTDGGAFWSLQSAPVQAPVSLYDIACPDATDCMAVGSTVVGGVEQGTALVTGDGGRHWQQVPGPAGAFVLTAVTCSVAGVCSVIATSGGDWSATTLDDGVVWERGGSLPAGFAGASRLSCVDLLDCVVAGYTVTTPGHGSGAVALTDDGGTDWSSGTVPSGTGILAAAACAAATCLAVGTTSTQTLLSTDAPGELLISTDHGTTWTARLTPAGMGDGAGVACPTTAQCAAVGTVWAGDPATPGGGIATTVDAGLAWTTPHAQYLADGLTGLSCPRTSLCVAVGGHVVARITLPALPAPKKRPHPTTTTTTTSPPYVVPSLPLHGR